MKKLEKNDRVISKRQFGWQKVRAGRVFGFSPGGGLAHVEWDDKLGPQVVNVADLDREPESRDGSYPACRLCGGCTEKILSSDEQRLTVRCGLCGNSYETRNAGAGK